MDKLFCKCCGHEFKRSKSPVTCKVCNAHNWDFGDNVPCQVCGRLLLVPTIHHINGNHKDNSKLNRMAICTDCHTAIHNGLKEHGTRKKRFSRTRTYSGYNAKPVDNELLFRLKYLRKIWLLHYRKKVRREKK